MIVPVLAASLLAAGAVVWLVGSVVTGQVFAGLPIALELWTAAGLLNLTADRDARTVATAAVIVAVRQGVVRGLDAARRGRVTPPRGPPSSTTRGSRGPGTARPS